MIIAVCYFMRGKGGVRHHSEEEVGGVEEVEGAGGVGEGEEWGGGRGGKFVHGVSYEEDSQRNHEHEEQTGADLLPQDLFQAGKRNRIQTTFFNPRPNGEDKTDRRAD